MGISFDKKILIEDNEQLENFAKLFIDKFATNKKDFISQLLNVLQENGKIKPDNYYLFKFQIGSEDKEISIPIYHIQNFSFFIKSDSYWHEAETFKTELNNLSKWANNLDYTARFNIDAPVSWESTLTEMFGTEKINVKALTDFINKISDTISELDKWLRIKLLTISSPLDVIKLVSESVLASDKMGYYHLYSDLNFYSKDAINRLDLFGNEVLVKYAKFWDFVFKLERWNKNEIDLTVRPIYNQRIKPAIEKIKELSIEPKFDSGKEKETESGQSIPEIKPKLKPEFVQSVFDLLKDFFSLDHQKKLKEILETGNNANEKLIFLDNGNRLADSFKQLIKSDIITGCEQKELETWILNNFQFRFRKEIKNFTPRYLNDIISTKKDLCKNPLFNVEIEKVTGKILIIKA